MKIVWIIIGFILVACESSPSNVTLTPKNSEKSAPAPMTAAPKEIEKPKPAVVLVTEKVVERSFKDEDLTGFEVPGVVDSGISWSDKKGRNVLVFSKVAKKAEVTFHIRHYVENASGTEKIIDLKEYLYCDRESLGIDIDKTRFSVQDLDSDGIGEPSFGYHVKCDDDQPNVAKFFLLEDGKKFKLTGTIKKKSTLEAGAFEANETLKSQPLFLKYLTDNWPQK